MTDSNSISKKHNSMAAIASVLTALLISMACLTGPSNEITPSGPPWEPVDSAWKVIENLQFAYNDRDIDLYMSCFREEFEFHLLELNILPGYSTNPDSFWGYEVEEQIHQNMFADVRTIDLNLSGTAEYPWTGDSTGQSYQLDRTFILKVYATTQGYKASGSALFICRPDSTGEWYVWLWWDLSETKEIVTWPTLKMMYY